MAFTRYSVPDLTGETTVITGANGGLGLQTARVFASKGARVVMAVHDQEKAARAVEEIRAETPDARCGTGRAGLGVAGVGEEGG